jgi:hypothetical protein
MADEPGSSLRTARDGGRGDPRGRFDGLQFRDESRTAIILAGGPSAADTLGRAASWADWPTVCVNDSWRLNQRAAAVYAADRKWWEQRDRPTGLRYVDLCRLGFSGGLFTSDERAARELELHYIALERKEGLSTTQGLIRTGGQIGNSGAQAMNLAFLWGARRLLLVGFDMCKRGELVHWFGDHPKGLQNDPPFERFVKGMGPLAADLHREGVEVINCCRWSALPYWPKRELADVL